MRISRYECDNNNDFDITVAAKHWTISCALRSAYPVSGSLLNMNLVGGAPSLLAPALTLGHPPPALEFLQKAWALLRCWKPVAERVLEQERPCSEQEEKGANPSQFFRFGLTGASITVLQIPWQGARLAFISSFGGRHQPPL